MSVCEDAEADLDALYANDEDSAALIDVFLQEAAASQEMLDRFTCQGYRNYGGDFDFDIKRWEKLWSSHALWRARLFYIENGAANYRIIYAFHPGERRYYILGIVPREFDYEPSHPLSQRIVACYNELGIP